MVEQTFTRRILPDVPDEEGFEQTAEAVTPAEWRPFLGDENLNIDEAYVTTGTVKETRRSEQHPNTIIELR